MLDTFRGMLGTLPLFGVIVATRAMLPMNPFTLPRVIIELPAPPAVKLIWVTVAEMLKSGDVGVIGEMVTEAPDVVVGVVYDGLFVALVRIG